MSQDPEDYLVSLGAGTLIILLALSIVLTIVSPASPPSPEPAAPCQTLSQSECAQFAIIFNNQRFFCQWNTENEVCEMDVSFPVECGNGIKEANEVCDGLDLARETCFTQGFVDGNLSCLANCMDFNQQTCIASPVAVCGNRVIDENETCDDGNLIDADGCSSVCAIETGWECRNEPSRCTVIPRCGNGTIEIGEECDGSALNSETCQTRGFETGILQCYPFTGSNKCQFDEHNCVERTCINHEICFDTIDNDCDSRVDINCTEFLHLEDVSQPIFSPQLPSPPPFLVSVSENGVLLILIKGQTIPVQTFSYTEPLSWRIEQSTSEKWVLQGENNQYSLRREVTQTRGQLNVQDTFQNKRNTVTPISFYTDFFLENTSLQKHFIGGLENQSALNFQQYGYGNTTLFASMTNFGLGAMLEDNVSKVQTVGAFDFAAKRLRFSNTTFGLGSQESYNLTWTIFLIDSNNYFDFINVVRAKQSVNSQTISNHLFLGYPDPNNWGSATEEDRNELFEQTSPRWISTQPYTGLHGPAIWEDLSPFQEQITTLILEKVLQSAPQTKRLLYLDLFLSSKSFSDSSYDSSRVTNASQQALWGQFFPSLSNRWGERMQEFVPQIVNRFGAEGVYLDDTLDSQWTYNQWDGYSLDSQQTRIANIWLLTSPYYAQFVQNALDDGLEVVANQAPLTNEVAALPIVRLVEMPSIENSILQTASRIHLATPVVLDTRPYTSNNPNPSFDNTEFIRKALDYGVLVYESSAHIKELYKTSDFYLQLFPITPLALFEGTIVGQEKIFTNRSGFFGWNDQSNFEVMVYTEQGNRLSESETQTRFRLITVEGKRFVQLLLQAKEISIIKRI